MELNTLLPGLIQAGFVKKNWFVSLTESLEGLTPKQAAFKDSDANHSIKEIVNHVTFWNEYYLNIFKGIPVKETAVDNDSTFSANGTRNGVGWEELLEKLKKVSSEWQDELSKAGVKKLQSNFPNSSEAWASVISNIIMHSAYHTGQIVVLRKQHGNWDKKFGV